MHLIKTLVAATLLIAGAQASLAVTVDIDGNTYEVVEGGIDITAEIGQSVTKSFAVAYSLDYDTVFATGTAEAATSPTADGYFTHNYDAQFIQLGTHSATTGFSVGQTGNATQDGYEWFYFDLTFAPTAATIASDSQYGFAPPASQGQSLAALEYDAGWDSFVVWDPTNPGFAPGNMIDPDAFTGQSTPIVELVDNSQDFFVDFIYGTAISAPGSGSKPGITPVPIPAPAALLALGLIGLGAAARRRG